MHRPRVGWEMVLRVFSSGWSGVTDVSKPVSRSGPVIVIILKTVPEVPFLKKGITIPYRLILLRQKDDVPFRRQKDVGDSHRSVVCRHRLPFLLFGHPRDSWRPRWCS